MSLSIDINCDMGESYGHFKIGNDQLIIPYITSCNVACGFHGGDPLHIEHTIQSALEHHVQVGAHPSYPDLQGFGRRPMKLSTDELTATVKYQVAAIKGVTESLGGKLQYVKPHGALYNAMAMDEKEALTVIKAIQAIDDQLAIMGLAGSKVEYLAKKMSIPFIREAFADRRYTSAGTLTSRSNKNAVINDPQEAAEQVLSIVQENKVFSDEGKTITIHADSVCIHGDNPKAVDILKSTHSVLTAHQIAINPSL